MMKYQIWKNAHKCTCFITLLCMGLIEVISDLTYVKTKHSKCDKHPHKTHWEYRSDKMYTVTKNNPIVVLVKPIPSKINMHKNTHLHTFACMCIRICTHTHKRIHAGINVHIRHSQLHAGLSWQFGITWRQQNLAWVATSKLFNFMLRSPIFRLGV